MLFFFLCFFFDELHRLYWTEPYDFFQGWEVLVFYVDAWYGPDVTGGVFFHYVFVQAEADATGHTIIIDDDFFHGYHSLFTFF